MKNILVSTPLLKVRNWLNLGATIFRGRLIFEDLRYFSFTELQDDYDFCVRVAFIELYKEKLYDLLSTKSKIKEDCMVDLREDPVKGVVITNLTEVVVGNLRQTMEQLEQGKLLRDSDF